jgi:hypothetical protein
MSFLGAFTATIELPREPHQTSMLLSRNKAHNHSTTNIHHVTARSQLKLLAKCAIKRITTALYSKYY